MEFFALTDQVTDLEIRLIASSGNERLELLVSLAWQLRQRDGGRAQHLCNEAFALLDEAGLQISVQQGATSRARLVLVRAELSWLLADLQVAMELGQSALSAFTELGDPCGKGDAYCLLASVHNELGDRPERDRLLQCAVAEFEAGNQATRAVYTKARVLTNTAFQDAHAAEPQLRILLEQDEARHPAVDACLSSALAVAVGHMADFGQSAKLFLQAYRDAMQSGQLRLAIVCACNGADTFASLGDLDSALEWDERALAQARLTGWPSTIAFALMQTGHVLRLLGRHADASTVLQEAIAVMDKLHRSRFYALTMQYLGDLSLDMDAPAAALDYFTQAADYAATLGERIFMLRCWSGQATALGRLDRPQEALVKANAALAMSQEDGCMDDRVKVLRVLAELSLQHALPHADGQVGPRAGLHYLEQALGAAATIVGFTTPSELLDEISNAYAACGDYRKAYEHAKAAALARDNKQFDDARNRALAMRSVPPCCRTRTQRWKPWGKLGVTSPRV